MLFIRQIYKKLCNLFVKKKEDNVNSDLVPIISVDIDKNNKRILNLYLPENLRQDEIIDMAELYAKAIIDMNNGTMAKETVSILKNNVDPNDPEQKMFVDNIVYFWTYLSAFEKHTAAIQNSEPVIKPSKVFKNQ